MARFVVDTEKRLGSEFWSNVYHIRAADMTGAEGLGQAIVAAERLIHTPSVTFTRFRVRTFEPEDETYVITTINQLGLREVSSTLLPLFNTLRVDLPAVTGRPSRKYYRGVLVEGDISGDAITTAFGVLLLDLGDALASGELDGIIDPQGQILTGVVFHPFVQMRQLRRSRRRRTNGGGIFQ